MRGPAECIWPLGAQLGEGPVWSDEALWFVDVKGRRIHCYTDHDRRAWPTPQDVGFIAPTQNGAFLCGLQSGLHRFDPASGAFTLLAELPTEPKGNRINDAGVDPSGRLWFGTMDDGEQRPSGALYRFDHRGLRRVDEGYVIPNGPAVSPDGRTLYPVDTMQGLICAVDVNDDGSLTNERVFTRVDVPGAHPDGATVDAEGCLWVALYGGWGVQRYSPQGALLETVALPVANCTKPAFGGPDLTDLFVTTAWRGLSAAERAQQPLAGGLFRVRTDVKGLAAAQVRMGDQPT